MNWTLLSSALIAAGLHAAFLGLRFSPSPARAPVPEPAVNDQLLRVDEPSWYFIVEEPTACFGTLWISGCGPFIRICPAPPVTDRYVARPITSYLPFQPVRPPALNLKLRDRDLIGVPSSPTPPRNKRPSNKQQRM